MGGLGHLPRETQSSRLGGLFLSQPLAPSRPQTVLFADTATCGGGEGALTPSLALW